MSEYSAAQISQLATALEQNPKLQAQFNALLGISSEEHEQPAPADSRKVEDSAPAPGKAPAQDEESASKKLAAHPKADVSSASDFLSTMHDYAMIRRVKQQNNFFVPNATRMMHTLNQMDKLIIRKFKARRAAMLMFPIIHVQYFAILWSLQTARCLHFAGYLDKQEDKDFLDFFLDMFPPEKIPIPGPLLPFFKSVTTFRHENPLFKRVSPGFPIYSMTNDVTDYHHITGTPGNVIFPNVPLIVDTTCRYLKKIFGDDYAADKPEGNIKNIKFPFPFAHKSTPANDEWAADVILGGYKFPKGHTNWSDITAASLTTPGMLYPIPINKDIVTNLAPYVEDLINPNASESEYQVTDLKTWLRMEKAVWFANLLGPMAEYSALWTGSGSLADCSVDGPSAGAYVYSYSTSETAPTKPPAPFNSASLFNLAGSVYTTLSTPQPSDERLGAFTQVHGDLALDHWFTPTLTAPHRSSGNVWDISPRYGPSVEITSALTVSVALESFIDPRVAK